MRVIKHAGILNIVPNMTPFLLHETVHFAALVI